jgi:glycosyltransferase involved in cell wall biosynthesis
MYKRKALKKLFTFSCEQKDFNIIPQKYIKNIKYLGNIDKLFLKLRLNKIISPSYFNYYKDNLFDLSVKSEINNLNNIDIFIGWTNYFINTFNAIRPKCTLVIAESGSAHIKEQQELLSDEYKKWGIKSSPIYQKTINKMTQEYLLADYIMTLSSFSYKSFIKWGISEKKLLKVPCGIETEFFISPPDNFYKRGLLGQGDTNTGLLASVNTELMPPVKPFRVIFVGLINIRKGIPYLLQAWDLLKIPEDKTELLLVGTVNKDCVNLISNITKKNIIVYGSTDRDTLKKLYYSSSVFVLPSIEEGFGMVAGEAMACGLPVICTTHTGISDIIKNNTHGFIIPPYNPEVLAEKIEWCYLNQDKAQEMGKIGKEHIKNFGWDNYGDRVYTLYQEILKQKCTHEKNISCRVL